MTDIFLDNGCDMNVNENVNVNKHKNKQAECISEKRACKNNNEIKSLASSFIVGSSAIIAGLFNVTLYSAPRSDVLISAKII